MPGCRRDLPFVRLAPLVVALLVGAGAGCFPYREIYRPDISGRVVDRDGTPQNGAVVEACSDTKWRAPFRDCPRRAIVATDAAGRFHFEPLPVPDDRGGTHISLGPPDDLGVNWHAPPPELLKFPASPRYLPAPDFALGECGRLVQAPPAKGH